MESLMPEAMPVSWLPPPGLIVRILGLLVRIAPTGLKFFSRSILLRKTLTPAQRVVLPAGLQWIVAGPTEIAWIAAHPEATSRGACQRRAERGDICICLKKGSEIVAYRWIARSRGCVFCGFRSREIRFLALRPNQAFLYDLFVYEAHRRHGYGTLLLQIIFEFLKSEGIDEVFCLADPDNHRVIRVELRLGFETVRMAYGVRIRQWGAMFFGPKPDRQLQRWTNEFKARAGIR
jgi:GNAT superfamily N-acetyltransferase